MASGGVKCHRRSLFDNKDKNAVIGQTFQNPSEINSSMYADMFRNTMLTANAQKWPSSVTAVQKGLE
jgi:hypothetical protein